MTPCTTTEPKTSLLKMKPPARKANAERSGRLRHAQSRITIGWQTQAAEVPVPVPRPGKPASLPTTIDPSIAVLGWMFYATMAELMWIFSAIPVPTAPVAALEPFRIVNRYGLFGIMTRGLACSPMTRMDSIFLRAIRLHTGRHARYAQFSGNIGLRRCPKASYRSLLAPSILAGAIMATSVFSVPRATSTTPSSRHDNRTCHARLHLVEWTRSKYRYRVPM